MGKKVVISGAYGRGNTGDEAILFSIINELRGIDNDIDITVLSKCPDNTKSDYGVESVYTFNIFKIIKTLFNSDLFISGGGTLLQNVTSTRSILYYLFTLVCAKICKCRVIMYSCGIGPIKGNIIRKISSFILDKCVDGILLRDSLSYLELSNLNIDMNKVDIGIDSSLLLDKYISLDKDILDKLEIDYDKKYVGICLSRYSINNIDEMVKVIKYLNSLGMISVLIPMDYNEDIGILKELGNKLDVDYYIIDKYLDILSKYSLISKMDLIIGSRLHAILFAYLSKVKIIGISYDKKIDAFCNDYGIVNYIDINQFNYDKFIYEFNNLKINRVNIKKINTLKKKNIGLLNKYLD